MCQAAPRFTEEENRLFGKKMSKEMTDFAADFQDKQEKHAANPNGKPFPDRQVRMTDGPAAALGMDGLMLAEMDKAGSTMLQMLDREDLAQRQASESVQTMHVLQETGCVSGCSCSWQVGKRTDLMTGLARSARTSWPSKRTPRKPVDWLSVRPRRGAPTRGSFQWAYRRFTSTCRGKRSLPSSMLLRQCSGIGHSSVQNLRPTSHPTPKQRRTHLLTAVGSWSRDVLTNPPCWQDVDDSGLLTNPPCLQDCDCEPDSVTSQKQTVSDLQCLALCSKNSGFVPS